MKKDENISKGVLNEEYAHERTYKKELQFRYKARAKIVEKAIKKYYHTTQGINILDYGAAEGLTMLELNKLLPGNQIVGLEYSEELIAECPSLPENMSIHQGDVTSVDEKIGKNNYDVITALALLEHLPQPEKALEAASQYLKKGGLFIASSPVPAWDDISVKLGLLKEEQHEVEMTKKYIKSLFNNSELEIVKYKKFMWAPISFLPYLKLPVSPKFAVNADQLVFNMWIFNFLFVNQLIIAKKA